MTYTFFNACEGRHVIYDSVSGAVINATELEAYICDALDPCGETLERLPEKCPSEIRYELARFASTEVSAAYEKIKSYFLSGLIYAAGDAKKVRTSGDHSASPATISVISSETGIPTSELELL